MMTIHFYLRFHSTFGQSFYVTGNIDQLGNGDTTKALPIDYLNEEFWHGSIEVDEKTTGPISYSYVLKNDDGTEMIEWGGDRVVDPSKLKAADIQLLDAWNYAGEFQNAFYTQPFQQTLFHNRSQKLKVPTVKNATHQFKVKSPLLQEDETLFITGSCPELGEWEVAAPTLMARDGNWYTARFDLSKAKFPIAYKYGVWNVKEQAFVRYEDGNNRMLHGDANKKQFTVLHDGFAYLPNTGFKGAGVAIPVFSLRSNNSFGVGEFSDIKLLVDWAKLTGLKLIQLLPINDTTAKHTWEDSYPYAAVSAFALHPMFIDLAKVAGKAHADVIRPLKRKQKQLNALPDVDYEQVMKVKSNTLKALYELMKEEWLADEGYKAFYELNKDWLVPYAAYCSLRDENKTSDFNVWKKLSVYDAKEAEKMVSVKSRSFDKVGIHLFTQYHLHLQLTEAVAYAHKNGIIMKGDIPIGVGRTSCDAWVAPELYHMDTQAGAPPDDFAVKGQNWGFPTYNWQKMQETGFSWWKQRFAQMSRYFDAFRIDHILGFFRIWSIPMHAVQGIMGRFVPCIPIYSSEFAERGIWFDHDRYCRPFINDMVIGEMFGEKASYVKETFIESFGWGRYKMKDEFNTQRKVEAWFHEQTDVEPWILERLYDLISNVIMFEEPGSQGQQFHFRISMESTLSFRYLDDHTKQQLKDLYVNYFFRRQDAFWGRQAMQKLPALKASTNMLVCGEDLGMVPDCVPGVMKDLGFLSLEIQRMPKDPKKQFFHPADAPYLSVVTPSTHDMSTIRGWWEEDRTSTQRFFNDELGKMGDAPFYCEPWINKEIVVQHLYSPAMWSIFQLQDLMGIDGELRRVDPNEERINVPANPKHYWRYRMHITLEDLLKQQSFNEDLSAFVKDSGRA